MDNGLQIMKIHANTNGSAIFGPKSAPSRAARSRPRARRFFAIPGMGHESELRQRWCGCEVRTKAYHRDAPARKSCENPPRRPPLGPPRPPRRAVRRLAPGGAGGREGTVHARATRSPRDRRAAMAHPDRSTPWIRGCTRKCRFQDAIIRPSFRVRDIVGKMDDSYRSTSPCDEDASMSAPKAGVALENRPESVGAKLPGTRKRRQWAPRIWQGLGFGAWVRLAARDRLALELDAFLHGRGDHGREPVP